MRFVREFIIFNFGMVEVKVISVRLFLMLFRISICLCLVIVNLVISYSRFWVNDLWGK